MAAMGFRYRAAQSPSDQAQSQLQAYAAKTMALITVEPSLFSTVDGKSTQAAQELLKGLEGLVKMDATVGPVVKRMRSSFPAGLDESVGRLDLLRLISDWLQAEELDQFATRDVQYQVALLKVVRVVLRWTKLTDDLNGFIEVLLEAVFSNLIKVQGPATMCLSTYAFLQQNMPLPGLFNHFQEALGIRLARRFLNHTDKENLSCVVECIRQFQFETVENLMSTMIPFLLQPLICDGSPSALTALEFVAQLLTKNVSDMLSSFFHYLLPVIVVRSGDDAALEKALQTIERLTGKPRSRLILKDINHIHNELLLYLDEKEMNEKVVRGLKFIAEMQGETLAHESDIPNYLQPRFLSFVFFADLKLVDPLLPAKTKRRVLRSFTVLMQVMGSKHISSVRIKLLAILKFVVQTFPAELQPVCFDAWSAFIRTMDMTSLKSILSQVAVILLPFIKTNPQFAIPLFEYLIVEKRQHLHEHYQELFFLPKIPGMERVNKVLVEYTGKTDAPEDFTLCLMDQLQFVDIMGITPKKLGSSLMTQQPTLEASAVGDRRLRVPQMEVRQYALRKLKMLLRNQQVPLYNMIMSPEKKTASSKDGPELSPISCLIVTLMNCCREAVCPEERQRFGEVLGSIGAVDPDWVELPDAVHGGLARWPVFPGVRHEAFAIDFLKELVKGYMTTDKTSSQDACGVVIQEALKFYNLRDDRKSRIEDGNVIWNQLSRDYQEILTPFLTSRYVFVLQDDDEPNPLASNENTTVLFGSTPALSSYGEWIRAWTVSMIERIPMESKNENNDPTRSTATKFFKQCVHLVQHDLNRCVALLPYVVLYLLVHCDPKQKEKLFAEMVAALKSEDLSTTESNADEKHPAAQAVLSLLDFLRDWCYHAEAAGEVRREQMLIDPTQADNGHCQVLVYDVEHFVAGFSDDVLARASFCCHAYPRALMHYEKYLWQEDSTWLKWRSDKPSLDFMQQVYVALEERDGVAGLNSVRLATPSTADKIVLHLSTGKIQEALLCYEQLAQTSKSFLLPDQHSSVMRGLMDLDEPCKAMLYCNGVLAENPEWLDELNGYRIEAAWKLGQWDALNGFIDLERHKDRPSEWHAGVGRLLLDAKLGDSEGFRGAMGHLQAQLMGPVCAANMEKGAYHRSYDNIVQLHTLFELEEGAQTWFGIQPDEEFPSVPKKPAVLLREWELRLHLAQPSYHNVQKILAVRRTILQATGDESFRGEIGASWLKSARIARKANHLQTAYSYLLKSEGYDSLLFPLENAKYLWAKGEEDSAIAYLEKATTNGKWLSGAKKLLIYPKTKLRLARYLGESKSLQSKEILRRFEEVVEIAPKLEKSHFYLGQYIDQMLVESGKPICDQGEEVLLIMEQFIQALRYGCHFIHQSLPRLLTLWLDFGALCNEKYPVSRKGGLTIPAQLDTVFKRIQELIRGKALTSIPMYVLLTAFPQLISRICTPNEEVFVLLMSVIAKIAQTFPQQTMWQLAPVHLSKLQYRNQRYLRTMKKVKEGVNDPLLRFFTHMEEFCRQLIIFSNVKTDRSLNGNNSNTFSMKDYGELRVIRRLLQDAKWAKPMLPFRTFMNPVLPDGDYSPDYQAFAPILPTIVEFGDLFTIVPSLQKPKRLTILDSTGIIHHILLKPKDDLRKDSRFMELVGMVNKFLRENSEARRRQLRIRTYSVVPLNEECGIIEWVPNIQTLRSILINTYAQEKRHILDRDELKAIVSSKHAPLEDKLRSFLHLVQRHPSVLHRWFERSFTDPTAWLAARLAYSRTCAVMCMVGYIMGLGDRHGENILLDTTTGEVMHVDYGCLFNQGENLEWPEKVPFRLTHNVVDGMGPLGVEGFYRSACELTLKVIRHQKNAMMSVLKPFLHDPLVEWQSKATTTGGESSRKTAAAVGGGTETGESQNTEAIAHIVKIERRIVGQTADASASLPLSVQGQVNHLIREATSHVNLSQMYVGWAAFL
ncbi:Serine/threonine-protein kinase atr [Hypsibius exemplaris]|uniref:Serine/threonine-protein kinase ATR n=1 Tax=Hypsibius exemplaris TaxID=2072580 RepID=A0A1W0WP80_HYPEX|nr:Serine/threonine-protein kinase atr [Hypsibius exemplaris]